MSGLCLQDLVLAAWESSQCQGVEGVQGCSSVPRQAPAGLADPCRGNPWANHRGGINWARVFPQTYLAWLGLGKGPVTQPQPDEDSNVCKYHMAVTQRAVATQVSDALILSWCPHSVGGPDLQAL